jgi:pimeloyl-ACP methyl ester carboxylesterase
MVPSVLSDDLHRRIKDSELIIYPDAGHGGIFQNHREFVPVALEFLDREQTAARTEPSAP